MKPAQLITTIAITLAASYTSANLFAYFKLKQLRNDAYRPTDRYSLGKRYASNIDVIETTRFGDLCALTGAQDQQQCSFSEGPRTALFKTDSRGWKTSQKFEKADFVIAGDSFLAALGGDSNGDQLGSKLHELTGKSFYEAAHPGDPGDYLSRVLELDQERPLQKKYILLIFEGNDLGIKAKTLPLAIPEVRSNTENLRTSPRAYIESWVETLKNPPVAKLISIYAKSYELQKNRLTRAADNSFIKEINGRSHAFGLNNSEVSRDRRLSLPSSLSVRNLGYLKNKIKCIVLAPTKYSVYLSKESLRERHPILYTDFKRLNDARIATIDLTPALRAEARRHPQRMLWWSDDTHWNKHGIAAAADAINEDIHCLR